MRCARWQRATPMCNPRPPGHLRDRWGAVLVLVAGGYSASEIGEQLFISPKTVETYKQRITEKLGLAHRSEYVQLCLRLGLLQAK
jgi:DNA-binding NarL/FixJ family response regulator